MNWTSFLLGGAAVLAFAAAGLAVWWFRFWFRFFR